MVPVTLSRVEPFVCTAELRSFRAAARHLGVTPAAVSKAVAALEGELGVVLLRRTSRHVAPTPEGEVFLRHCRAALDQLSAGHDLVTAAAHVPEGRLKVSLSHVFGRFVVGSLDRFLRRHPRVEPVLSFTDEAVDLVREEVDVAVRIGELPDSALVSRLLARPWSVTVASPEYLARRGRPSTPDALPEHTCLLFARPSGRVAPFRFEPPVSGLTGIVLNQGELLVDAAVHGLGIAQVFDFMVTDALARGTLQELLVEHRTAGPPVHALVVAGRQQVPKIRVFLDFLTELFPH